MTEYYWAGLNLQLLAEERTEPATPRRRQKARERGQVVRSAELNSAVLLLAGFLALRLGGGHLYQQVTAMTREIILGTSGADPTVAGFHRLMLRATWYAASAVWPVLVATFLAGLAVSYLQVGSLFTLEPLKPNLGRINPLEGFKRIFSKRALVELVKALLKVTVVTWVAYSTLRGAVVGLPNLSGMEVGQVAAWVGLQVWELAIKTGLAILVMSAFDYAYQRYEHEVSLRMTKQQLKEETKETEGDPQIRGQVRRRQREMARRRMMAAVPTADVVITNPTHYAVALRYIMDQMEAPEVVAKGQDYLAQRIKEVAREHHVPLVENMALAQGLYRSAEVGQSIPIEYYQAVAEVLAFVYRLKHRA